MPLFSPDTSEHTDPGEGSILDLRDFLKHTVQLSNILTTTRSGNPQTSKWAYTDSNQDELAREEKGMHAGPVDVVKRLKEELGRLYRKGGLSNPNPNPNPNWEALSEGGLYRDRYGTRE